MVIPVNVLVVIFKLYACFYIVSSFFENKKANRRIAQLSILI